MSETQIDVIIPVFNGAKTIESSLNSILRQSYSAFALHVVDDGSTDDTAVILARLAAGDQRIRIHRQDNSGIVDALNNGLSKGISPFVARHDADDIAYPNRFEVQLRHLMTNPQCVAVGAAVRHIDADGRPTGTSAQPAPPENADPFSFPSREPYIIHPFLMARRTALMDAGGYRYVHHSEDTDLYWRLMGFGTLHNLPDFLGEYRLHAESISGSSLKNGRMMSVFSQLAAVSEQRRRVGGVDLLFDKGLIDKLKGMKELAEMVQCASQHLALKPAETEYLAAAAATKILELTAYRPYELESSDAKFIRAAVASARPRISAANMRQLRKQLSGTAARLVSKRQLTDGISLVTADVVIPFIVRLGIWMALPGTIRKRMRASLVDESPVK